MDVDLLPEWVNELAAHPDENERECDAVARAALEHLGKRYRITRELRNGLIDCSTVVSQAHWIGAAVRVPFIAESQRNAANATAVESIADVLPGDVLVAYPSVAASPGPGTTMLRCTSVRTPEHAGGQSRHAKKPAQRSPPWTKSGTMEEFAGSVLIRPCDIRQEIGP